MTSLDKTRDKSRFFNGTIVALLTFVLVTPTAFFAAPHKAAAQQLFQAPPLQTFTPSAGTLPVDSVPSFTPANVNTQFGNTDLLSNGEFSSAYNDAYDAVINSGGTTEAAKAAGTAATGETAASVSGTEGAGCLGAIAGTYAAATASIAGGATVLGTGTGIKTDPAVPWSSLGACLTSTMQLIQQTIISAATVSSAAAAQALVIDAYVLQPLAFVLSGNLLKLITQGVIAFVIGKANGTGIPQFVADIRASLQTVSDTHALAYFDQFIRSTRSPWNTAILSQLSKEYLNETSLAGFWAANMDTLKYTSPYAFGYLNGNWAQGGVSSWFALTTQFQNNPYMLYPAVKDQLASVIGPGVPGATGARVLDINNGQGVVSWCGDSDGFLGEMTTDVRSGVNAAGVDQAASDAYDAAYNDAIAAGENADAAGSAAYDAAKAKALAAGQSELQATEAAIEARRAAIDAAHARAADATQEALAAQEAAKSAAFAQAKAANAGNNFMGVAPGDPCTNADGTTGTIKTPGSVILASLNKVLGGQQDNVVRMGNVGPEINNILANIGVVLKTVNFATQILGGPGSNGIFGVDQPAPGETRSALQAYANSSGNLGATNSGVSKSAATFSVSGPDMLSRVAKYEAAVNIIREAANTASTSMSSLITYCTGQLQTASTTLSASPAIQSNIDAARNALATKITPTLTQTDSAAKIIAAARELVQKIQNERDATTETAAAAYAVDIQTLQNLPPSLTDISNAQQASIKASGSVPLATSSPTTPLTVSGGSLVDQLSLLSTNADALRLTCVAP